MSEHRELKKRCSGSCRVFLRRHLMLSQEFAELLLKGIKKSTIRLGIVVPKYDEVIIHSGGRPIAKARIVDVRYKKLYQLTDEDAKLDGFSSLNELLDVLKKTYKNINKDNDVTIIVLEVLQRFDKLRNEDIYYGLSPSDIARIGLRYLKNELSDEEKRILELLSGGLSIRGVANKLYGSPYRRLRVRRVVRKVLRELLSREFIKIQEDLSNNV